MQLRCTYCQTMFAISREEMLAGLEHMEENKLAYYDAHCPKCRRANRVERARMERFFPDWKKVIKTMTKEADQAAAGDGRTSAAKLSIKAAAASKAAPKPQKKKSAPTTAKKPAAAVDKKVAPKVVKKPAVKKK